MFNYMTDITLVGTEKGETREFKIKGKNCDCTTEVLVVANNDSIP